MSDVPLPPTGAASARDADGCPAASMAEGAVGAAMAAARVVPVVTLPDAAAAVPLVGALAAGGLPVVEITLRTPDALAGIARAVAEVPDAVVGAGTVLTAAAATDAVAAGARFLVSPGFDDGVVAVAHAHDIPCYPGVATATELMRAVAAGVEVVKLFPASVLGGPVAVQALAAVVPGTGFLPTGGIDAATAPSYLRLPQVVAVGGSWMVDRRALATGAWSWEDVRAAAAEAAAVGAAS